MDFKLTLKLLSQEGKTAQLTSSELSTRILDSLGQPQASEPGNAKLLSTKRLSGDLDRLYKMGLASRKKAKRMTISVNSSAAYRGFEYRYKVSKQGWQYLEYLNRRQAAKPNRNLLAVIEDHIAVDIYKRFPESLAEYLAGAFEDKPFEDRGRHRRFPTQKYLELVRALIDCRRRLAAKTL